MVEISIKVIFIIIIIIFIQWIRNRVARGARPPSFQKTQKVPSLSCGTLPLAFVKNVVQIAFFMIAFIRSFLPPLPSHTVANIFGKRFIGVVFFPKLALETVASEPFDSSCVPVFIFRQDTRIIVVIFFDGVLQLQNLYLKRTIFIIHTRKYMHAETLALLTKPLYFPNMKYLEELS